MFAASSVSMPSPTRGCSIIVIPIEWPVTWPRWKPRSVNPFETARWTSWAVAPSRITSRGVVLAVGLHHRLHLRRDGADRTRDLDPVHPRAGNLERGDDELAEHRPLP